MFITVFNNYIIYIFDLYDTVSRCTQMLFCQKNSNFTSVLHSNDNYFTANLYTKVLAVISETLSVLNDLVLDHEAVSQQNSFLINE